MNFATKYQRPATRLRNFDRVGLTIPDQTMSLRTMVKKYVRGLPIAAPELNGVYTGDEIAQDFTKLDYVDQDEMKSQVAAELVEHRKRAQEYQKLHVDEISKLKAELEALKSASKTD